MEQSSISNTARKTLLSRFLLALVLLLGLRSPAIKATYASGPPLYQPALAHLPIPSMDDWQEVTVAFSHGAEGEWDHYIWGGFANSLIKRGNTYYLYYQGATSYDEPCGDVTYRAIGLATSTDGIHWTKSPNNPVITFASPGRMMEGATSSAAWVGADGRIYIYYGANSAISSTCFVRANARLAVSEDGEHFQDLGEVLSSSNPNVWGAGDEIFPVGAYSHNGKWMMFYIPNGVSVAAKLGVAIGDRYDTFTQSVGVNNSSIPAWGPVSVILNGTNSVLFTNPNGVSGPINVYRFKANNPSSVSLYDSYQLPNCRQASVLYESSIGRWLMACRDSAAEQYIIRQANLSGTPIVTPTYTPSPTTTATRTATGTRTVTPIYTPSPTTAAMKTATRTPTRKPLTTAP